MTTIKQLKAYKIQMNKSEKELYYFFAGNSIIDDRSIDLVDQVAYDSTNAIFLYRTTSKKLKDLERILRIKVSIEDRLPIDSLEDTSLEFNPGIGSSLSHLQRANIRRIAEEYKRTYL